MLTSENGNKAYVLRSVAVMSGIGGTADTELRWPELGEEDST
jgi:hypothetical protein